MVCVVHQLGSIAMQLPSFSLSTSVLLLATIALFLLFLRPVNDDNNSNSELSDSDLVEEEPTKAPPGPKPWPIYGSLHLLAADANPWEAFRRLRKEYGDIFQITLGQRECVVVSSLQAMKEVLVQKAFSFSSRPNFIRYHALFGGNRDNSLALCDWSNLQKARRKVAYPFVFPRSTNLELLETVISTELDEYILHLRMKCASDYRNHTLFDKFQFSAVCANIFFRYFCSKRYDFRDSYFLEMVKRYDDIFHDINNGFAIDFLPWLAPFKVVHLAKLYGYGQYIRKFLLDTLIRERTGRESPEGEPKDFMDAVLYRGGKPEDGSTTNQKAKNILSDEDALYELEDLLGGHSAVASFWTRLLAQVINRHDVKARIRAEIDTVVGEHGDVTLNHRSKMPYIQAVVMETLRVTTSPIVPHVATEDATIGGFRIKKDTMIFLNNYYLNLSEKHWDKPMNFDPDRFLTEDGKVKKPEHFLPFSTGQRSCLGYQLVHAIVFLATVKLFQNFNVDSNVESAAMSKVPTRRISRDVECAKLSVNDTDVKAVIQPRQFGPSLSRSFRLQVPEF